MRAVQPWGQENMMLSICTCWGLTPERTPSRSGTHIQRKAHFITAEMAIAAHWRAP